MIQNPMVLIREDNESTWNISSETRTVREYRIRTRQLQWNALLQGMESPNTLGFGQPIVFAPVDEKLWRTPLVHKVGRVVPASNQSISGSKRYSGTYLSIISLLFFSHGLGWKSELRRLCMIGNRVLTALPSHDWTVNMPRQNLQGARK